MLEETKAYKLGYEHGKRASGSVWNGNTTKEEYLAILEGYEYEFVPIMDLCPNPLSGEWANESISELFGLNIGDDMPDDEELADYENGFQIAFWDSLLNHCKYMTEEESVS